MATPTFPATSVGLIRLRPGTSAARFERSLRAAVPELRGSLLGWLHDDWYALAADVMPALRQRAGPPRRKLESAGAIAYRAVPATAFAAIASLRDLQAGRSSTRLRDREVAAGLEIEPPQFWWPGTYQGRPVRIDWQVAAVDIPAAWAQLAPMGPASYAGIQVGQIDTGYTEHPAFGFGTPGGTWLRPDLGKNYWKDELELSGSGEGPARWEQTPEYPGPRDNLSGPDGGHGTRTGSVLSGLYVPAEPPIEFPFFGAAPGVAVIPYRITDAVWIDHVQHLLAKAIRDATALGVQVLSISLGALRRSGGLARAVNDAYQQGVIVCAAAGNIIPSVVYPGRLNCVVTVGGATTTDGRDFHPWRQSSRGATVDICGPADSIRRASTVRANGEDRFLITNAGDGTSYATALCAGIAVLWLARRGAELDALYGSERWARAAAFRQLIASTARVPPGWPTDDYGAGIYQAGALLSAPLPAIESLQRQSDA